MEKNVVLTNEDLEILVDLLRAKAEKTREEIDLLVYLISEKED